MSILRGGLGRKKPQLDIKIEHLHPDPNNPRLPRQYQGRKESELIEALYKFFSLEEIAISMFENGYFDAEPLVVIPENLPKEFEGKEYEELNNDEDYKKFIEDPKTHFIVVEGNRRLSTAKLLLTGGKKKFPLIEDAAEGIAEDIKILPVIVYPQRKDVLAYIGARHIIGTKKWDAYAKARYVASLKEEHGLDMDEIQKTVGDTGNSARKIYACYKLIEKIEEEFENIDTGDAKDNFSFLMLATGQGSAKDYIGLEKRWDKIDFDSEIIPNEKLDHLRQLFLWLFGDGKDNRRVIKESRDITNYLSDILRSKDAMDYLKTTGDLIGAFDRSGGVEKLAEKYIRKANTSMESAMGLIHKSDSENIKEELENLEELVNRALKYVENV